MIFNPDVCKGLEIKRADSLGDEEWLDAAILIQNGIPNSVISYLGTAFNAEFYKAIACASSGCGYFAIDKDKKVVGIVVGALDRDEVYYRSIRSRPFLMATLAGFRVFSLPVLKWIIAGIRSNVLRTTVDNRAECKAELVVIAVNPEKRGSGIAHRLIKAMESEFIKQSGERGYMIRTEAMNVIANHLYERLGAEFIEVTVFHGRRINSWYKRIPYEV